MHLRTLVLATLVFAACGNKHDSSGAPPGSVAAPATTTAPAAKAPAAALKECDVCRTADACCKAIDESEAKHPISCTRAELCDEHGGTSDVDVQMRKDLVDTCNDRLAGWRKDHPDVAACK